MNMKNNTATSNWRPSMIPATFPFSFLFFCLDSGFVFVDVTSALVGPSIGPQFDHTHGSEAALMKLLLFTECKKKKTKKKRTEQK